MPGVTKKKKPKGPARERLLSAAEDVFSRLGYAAARVSDITRQAGLAQGTFYLYFESKQAVFAHLTDQFFAEVVERTLAENPASAVADADQMTAQIAGIWHTILSYCRLHPKLATLVLNESASLPLEERNRLAEQYGAAAAALAAYCRVAIERGLMRPVDPQLAAWVVIGMVERAVHYAIFTAPERELDAVVADLIQIELSGLLIPSAQRNSSQ